MLHLLPDFNKLFLSLFTMGSPLEGLVSVVKDVKNTRLQKRLMRLTQSTYEHRICNSKQFFTNSA